MLNLHRQIAKPIQNPRPQSLKQLHPRRVVIDNRDLGGGTREASLGRRSTSSRW
jgi:hypothetical protein